MLVSVHVFVCSPKLLCFSMFGCFVVCCLCGCLFIWMFVCGVCVAGLCCCDLVVVFYVMLFVYLVVS